MSTRAVTKTTWTDEMLKQVDMDAEMIVSKMRPAPVADAADLVSRLRDAGVEEGLSIGDVWLLLDEAADVIDILLSHVRWYEEHSA